MWQQHKTQLAALALWTLAGTDAGAVDILSRQRWGAQPARAELVPPKEIVATGLSRVRAENKMPVREKAVYLTVHHNNEAIKTMPLAEQLRAHQENMFDYTITNAETGVTTRIFLGDTPYHFFIDATGEVAEGRELKYAAYSNTVYVTPIAKHITIVLEGNFEDDPATKKTREPTDQQMTALVDLLAQLAKEHKVKLKNIGYHQGVVKTKAVTTCPGKSLIARFDEVKTALKTKGVR